MHPRSNAIATRGAAHPELERWEDPDIGCILLVEPFFWPEELWISQPEDWAPNIVRGKTYDLTAGIGRKLWDDDVARLQAAPPPASSPAPGEGHRLELGGGYGEPVPTRRRLGQGTFQAVVLDAYGRQCAITQEKAVPALDAAHIRPFAENPVHELNNGLLLRSDVHRLFDAGYITVTPEHRVEASHQRTLGIWLQRPSCWDLHHVRRLVLTRVLDDGRPASDDRFHQGPEGGLARLSEPKDVHPDALRVDERFQLTGLEHGAIPPHDPIVPLARERDDFLVRCALSQLRHVDDMTNLFAQFAKCSGQTRRQVLVEEEIHATSEFSYSTAAVICTGSRSYSQASSSTDSSPR
jgi:hypothetical protein